MDDPMTRSAYTVNAVRWEHGWELHVEDLGVTQCATLDQADRQVRDLICTVHDVDSYDGGVVVTVDDEKIAHQMSLVNSLTMQVRDLSKRASDARMELMTQMRDQGYSYADIGGAAGVSKGRVSQLIGK